MAGYGTPCPVMRLIKGDEMRRCYVRTSTDEQCESIETQLSALQNYAERIGEDVAFYIDEDVSAFKNRFRKRPAGKQLHDDLVPGDIVTATRYDRLFRKPADGLDTGETWEEMGVVVQFKDQPAVNWDNPREWFMYGLDAITAGNESRMCAYRQRESQKERRRKGRKYGSIRHYGWTWCPKKDDWVELKAERKIAGYVVFLRDNEGYSWDRIHWQLRLERKKKPVCQKGAEGYYSRQDVQRLHRDYLAGFPIYGKEFS